MDYKEIISDKETKDIILKTTREIYDIVSTTFGPYGNTVMIPSKEDYMKHIITKDGVSVMEQIKFKDPAKNIIAKFLKDATRRTVQDAGDGTTTTVVLLYAFIKNCIDLNLPSKEINKAFDTIIPQVLKEIDKQAKKLKTKDINAILNISSNGDELITNNIASIIDKTNNIKLIEHFSKEDIVSFKEGLVWDSTYHSKHFINSLNNDSAVHNDASVILIEGKLLNIKPYSNIINEYAQINKPLVIVTEHIHENVLRTLENLFLTKKLEVVVVKTPGMSEYRKSLLYDLSKFTGAEVIKGDSVTTVTKESLGEVSSITVEPLKTTFLKHPSIDISEYISELKIKASNKELPQHAIESLEKRISILEGALGVIYVGGNSEAQIKERYDRYDDAIKAVISAKEEGILPGAGTVLYNIGNKLKQDYKEDSIEYKILESLELPYNKLSMISGNPINLEEDLFKSKIIDPVKVVKSSLVNSSACANTILGTKGILLTNLF